MAYSGITKPGLHFNTKLYTGTGSTHNVTGVGFQPDFTWIKCRSHSDDHNLVDAVRGVTKYLQSNSTIAEATYAGNVSAFGTDGFTVGDGNQVNQNGRTFVSWNWKGGASQSLNSGNVTSTVRADTTAGFSIVKWTGTAGNILVSHGLGAIPKVVMIKNFSNGSAQWVVYHVGTGNTKACYLNTTATPTTASGFFNNSTPDATDFIVSSDTAVNGSGNSMIAYCFAEKKGFSKFGSYTGNGNADGTFVYTGFKPAFVLTKNASSTSEWHIYDNKRDTINPNSNVLSPNASYADSISSNCDTDFLSNGFKLRNSNSNRNENGSTHIFMAFASEPLVANVGNSIPATAR